MIEFSSKWQNFSPKGFAMEVSKVSKAPFETFDTSIAEALSEKVSAACTCPTPSGPAGCGPNYPTCSFCQYTWYCKNCGGCRQCASPGRKVRQPENNTGQGKAPVGDGQLPPLDRPPATETELRRLIDYLADPVAFAQWFARLMQQTDPAEELAAPGSSEYEGE
jgi:hypothetical protein